MRKMLVPLVAAAALAVPAGIAVADDPGGGGNGGGNSATTLPSRVTDISGAEAFTLAYIRRHADDLVNNDLVGNDDNGFRSRVRARVLESEAACLDNPGLLTEFGCAFTARIRVGQDRPYVRSSRAHGVRPQPQPIQRRARTFGCLGLLHIEGGPSVTPTATVDFADCVRLRSGTV